MSKESLTKVNYIRRFLLKVSSKGKGWEDQWSHGGDALSTRRGRRVDGLRVFQRCRGVGRSKQAHVDRRSKLLLFV